MKKYQIENAHAGDALEGSAFTAFELDAKGDTFEEMAADAYVWRVDKDGEVVGGGKLSDHGGAIYGRCLDLIKQCILKTDAKNALLKSKGESLEGTHGG